jgi:hypothetical protein
MLVHKSPRSSPVACYPRVDEDKDSIVQYAGYSQRQATKGLTKVDARRISGFGVN